MGQARRAEPRAGANGRGSLARPPPAPRPTRSNADGPVVLGASRGRGLGVARRRRAEGRASVAGSLRALGAGRRGGRGDRDRGSPRPAADRRASPLPPRLQPRERPPRRWPVSRSSWTGRTRGLHRTSRSSPTRSSTSPPRPRPPGTSCGAITTRADRRDIVGRESFALAIAVQSHIADTYARLGIASTTDEDRARMAYRIDELDRTLFTLESIDRLLDALGS